MYATANHCVFFAEISFFNVSLYSTYFNSFICARWAIINSSMTSKRFGSMSAYLPSFVLPNMWVAKPSFIQLHILRLDFIKQIFSEVEGDQKRIKDSQIPPPKPRPGKMQTTFRQEPKVKKYQLEIQQSPSLPGAITWLLMWTCLVFQAYNRPPPIFSLYILAFFRKFGETQQACGIIDKYTTSSYDVSSLAIMKNNNCIVCCLPQHTMLCTCTASTASSSMLIPWV